MTVLTVALKYLRGRFVASALTSLSVALGVSLVIASGLLSRGIKQGFIEGTTDYSLLVGAKGTPTQLVLGFGDLGERAIRSGIATIGDLLRG